MAKMRFKRTLDTSRASLDAYMAYLLEFARIEDMPKKNSASTETPSTHASACWLKEDEDEDEGIPVLDSRRWSCGCKEERS